MEKNELAVKVIGYCTESCATLIDNDIHNIDVEFQYLGNVYILKMAKKEEVIIMDVNPK